MRAILGRCHTDKGPVRAAPDGALRVWLLCARSVREAMASPHPDCSGLSWTIPVHEDAASCAIRRNGVQLARTVFFGAGGRLAGSAHARQIVLRAKCGFAPFPRSGGTTFLLPCPGRWLPACRTSRRPWPTWACAGACPTGTPARSGSAGRGRQRPARRRKSSRSAPAATR